MAAVPAVHPPRLKQTVACRASSVPSAGSLSLFYRLALTLQTLHGTEIEGALRHLADGGQLSQTPSGAEESTLRAGGKSWALNCRTGPEHWKPGPWLFRAKLPICWQGSLILSKIGKSLSNCAFASRWAVITRTLWWLRSQGFL
jgi:hypothetical protein